MLYLPITPTHFTLYATGNGAIERSIFHQIKVVELGFAITTVFVEPNQNGFFKSLRNIERSWTRRHGRYCVFTS